MSTSKVDPVQALMSTSKVSMELEASLRGLRPLFSLIVWVLYRRSPRLNEALASPRLNEGFVTLRSPRVFKSLGGDPSLCRSRVSCVPTYLLCDYSRGVFRRHSTNSSSILLRNLSYPSCRSVSRVAASAMLPPFCMPSTLHEHDSFPQGINTSQLQVEEKD
ncbi:hypothetical protein RHMOL_Rhmol03G0142500 [Rhododendron molle]|uniref:Uncharacterized protein n=1 Tax=Rhododendron molle TaxID=49168 RepID=A0ACC0PDS9_RHOML|nr:hypothetical protein RHMOL_Rhmol03G0142500 [Rhododendron molle]